MQEERRRRRVLEEGADLLDRMAAQAENPWRARDLGDYADAVREYARWSGHGRRAPHWHQHGAIAARLHKHSVMNDSVPCAEAVSPRE